MPFDPTYITREDEAREQEAYDREMEASHAQDALDRYEACRNAAVELICALYKADAGSASLAFTADLLNKLESALSFNVYGYRRDAVERIIQWLPENGYLAMRQEFDEFFHKPLSEQRRTIREGGL